MHSLMLNFLLLWLVLVLEMCNEQSPLCRFLIFLLLFYHWLRIKDLQKYIVNVQIGLGY